MSHHDVRNHATAGPAHRAPAEELAAYGSALGLDSSHRRTARSHDPAGFIYNPTMSRTFSTNCGSLENLKFSTRCGCNPKACQIRTMAVCDSPVFPAISRLLQWVLLSGIDSSVWVMTSSTCASVMDRGAPGRGSSNSPSSRPTRKRSRHLQTVAPVTCNFFATTPLLHPSSHPSTILARIASAWADFGRRASIASFSFSSGVTFSGLVGRPMATFEYAAISVLFQCFSNSGH